jgi:drug/metabolite transporter (DMT)-like permease
MEKSGGSWRMATAMAMSGTIGLFVLGSGQPVHTVVLMRCLLGGVALLAWLLWKGQWKRLDRRSLLWLLAGGAALVVNWLCLFSAYRLASISVATIVYHVQPFFLILLAALAQRQLPQARKLAVLGVAFAGVALTTGIDVRHLDVSVASGALLALLAAFLYAINTLATRQLSGYAPAQIAGLQLLLGALVLAPLSPLPAATLDGRAWACLLVLGLGHTAVMYNLMYGAYQRLAAERIAILSFIYPLVAMLVDKAAFHTTLTPVQWAGMGLILAALLVNQRLPAAPTGLTQRA